MKVALNLSMVVMDHLTLSIVVLPISIVVMNHLSLSMVVITINRVNLDLLMEVTKTNSTGVHIINQKIQCFLVVEGFQIQDQTLRISSVRTIVLALDMDLGSAIKAGSLLLENVNPVKPSVRRIMTARDLDLKNAVRVGSLLVELVRT